MKVNILANYGELRKAKNALDWAVKALATFQTWFAGVAEYLNTPYEKLVEIYLSFKPQSDSSSEAQ